MTFLDLNMKREIPIKSKVYYKWKEGKQRKGQDISVVLHIWIISVAYLLLNIYMKSYGACCLKCPISLPSLLTSALIG